MSVEQITFTVYIHSSTVRPSRTPPVIHRKCLCISALTLRSWSTCFKDRNSKERAIDNIKSSVTTSSAQHCQLLHNECWSTTRTFRNPQLQFQRIVFSSLQTETQHLVTPHLYITHMTDPINMSFHSCYVLRWQPCTHWDKQTLTCAVNVCPSAQTSSPPPAPLSVQSCELSHRASRG